MTEEEFSALWRSLVERSYRAEGPPLSIHERRFYAVNLLRGSVSRSGFIGYFENVSGADIANASDGLRALRLESVLALFEVAKNVVFGDRLIPNDSSLAAVFPDSLNDAEYEIQSGAMGEAIGPVQDEFYKYDSEIWSALCDYADAHELRAKG